VTTLDASSLSGRLAANSTKGFRFDSHTLADALFLNHFLSGGIGGQCTGVYEDVGFLQRQLGRSKRLDSARGANEHG
jgi:hypothetical protein